jgi:PAS domain S-box-containing protein
MAQEAMAHDILSSESGAQDSLLAAIVESSDDAIIGKDLNGIVTSWNKGAERIFGYTATEMVGQNIAKLVPPDDIDEMPSILERIRRGERVDHYETVRLSKDGRRVNISLTVSPVHDNNGKTIGASKIARDITEKKLSEQALFRHTERLMRANADLQQFAFITSHDLQEPLRTIAACTEMFLSKSGSKITPEEREGLELSVHAARRMTDMVKDLLTYARAMDEDLPMERVSIAEALEWASNNLYLAIQSSGAQIQYDRDELPYVDGNKIAMLQLFQNLLGNSVKNRGPAPLSIEIKAERTDDHWLLSVQDNGIGINPAYHQRIFSLFQRLRPSQYPGTGIGLALCRRIVQAHGGAIWVESEEGKGATFKFTLPVKGDA